MIINSIHDIMEKFLLQQNSFILDLYFLACNFKKMAKHIIIVLIMIFSVSSTFAQQTIAIDNPTGGFNINGSLTAGAVVGDWIPGTGSGGFVLNNNGTAVNNFISGRKIDGYKSGPQDLIFSTGSKFNDNPNTWTWAAADAGGKGDINNVLYHIGNTSTNEQYMIVAGDRKETNGTSYIDFEFLQNTLTRNATTGKFNSAGPDGGRTKNDVVISIQYVNGGSSANILLYLWLNVGTIANPNWTYVPQAVDPTKYYGFTNLGTTSVPYGAFGTTTYISNQFVEAAFNVSKVLQSSNICDGLKVKTLLIKTKSSDTLTAALDDFIEPIQVGLDLGTASIG
jgi:predicted membrane protein